MAGSLSRIRFATVSDRFIAEIGKIDSVSSSNQNLKLKTSSNASKETKLEIFIRCMRYLKLTVYPMDALEETAEFLAVCAEIFQNSHSIRIKHAYCRVFIDLLEPIAAVSVSLLVIRASDKFEETYLSRLRQLKSIFPLGNKQSN